MPSINGKQHYIILSNSLSTSGLNIDITANIITKVINSTATNYNDISLGAFFSDAYPEKYKNRIILSQLLNGEGQNPDLIKVNACLITQNNIKNNMKFIHDLSNTNRKILFIKNQNTTDNQYNYLIEEIYETLPILTTYYHLNYYFNYFNNITYSKDYFNIKIKDFIYIGNNYSIDLDSTQFTIVDFSSNPIFSYSNTASINYKSFDFSTLFIDTSINNVNNVNNTDISINKLYKNTQYSVKKNIYIYNKLTLDFTNINSYTFNLYNGNALLNLYDYDTVGAHTFNTFMIRTDNFNIINNIKANSNILFSKNNIFLHNVKVIDNFSNFYTTNPLYKKLGDFRNTIFLSLGKQISGITQYDIYNNTHIFSKNKLAFDISKIIFKSNINSTLVTTNNLKYNSLVTPSSYFYLLDFTFNYKHNTNNINNCINYNNILLNYIEYNRKKIFDLNISNIIDFSYTNSTYINNNYINNVNNLSTINSLNNLNSLNSLNMGISYEDLNNALIFKLKNINYDRTTYRLNNIADLSADLYKSSIQYDVRYNYGSTIPIILELDILLNNNLLDLCNNYPFTNSYNDSYYSNLNFYSVQVANVIITTQGSDFDNVDCIFVYHDPATETDPSFLYPYSNIEIIKDDNIDSLEKAIVVLPGARTSRTNSTFIPGKNGSNLSRKMIQGLIGLNNVPKLLSIVPYDPTVINGRGFINQYRIDDTCKDYEGLVINKRNSIKHYSVKDNLTNSTTPLINTNFANVVRSNARSRLSQVCIDNLLQNSLDTQNAYLNTPVVTPFRMFIRK